MRALNAFRPAHLGNKIHAHVRIGKVANRGLQRLWKFGIDVHNASNCTNLPMVRQVYLCRYNGINAAWAFDSDPRLHGLRNFSRHASTPGLLPPGRRPSPGPCAPSFLSTPSSGDPPPRSDLDAMNRAAPRACPSLRTCRRFPPAASAGRAARRYSAGTARSPSGSASPPDST